jgi:cyclophilin family peptidyl-prolyl cis-trans isomerase
MASHPNRHRGTDAASSYICLSQFFITFAPCEHLDGIHPPFGRLLHGWGVLDAIEACAEAKAVVIEDVIVVDEPFGAVQAAIDAASRDSRPKDSRITAGGSAIGKYLPRK